jgi:hypothetical protein
MDEIYHIMLNFEYMYKICDHFRRKIPDIFKKKTDSFFTGIAATYILQTESCINFINIFIKQNIADDIMKNMTNYVVNIWMIGERHI